jgi:hypothetical protein
MSTIFIIFISVLSYCIDYIFNLIIMKINNHKTTLLICPLCNKEYYKTNSEINRNLKLNRLNFCSIKCASKYKLSLDDHLNIYRNSKNNKQHLKKLNNISKEKSLYNFKYYLRSTIKTRQFINLTTEYLKELWDKQKGICPYTNIKLIPQTLSKSINSNNPYEYASLDRIDSSKGYIEGNVEFVSLGINLLKNKYSKKVVINFLNIIKLQDALAGN